jgi:hypothetical protein
MGVPLGSKKGWGEIINIFKIIYPFTNAKKSKPQYSSDSPPQLIFIHFDSSVLDKQSIGMLRPSDTMVGLLFDYL